MSAKSDAFVLFAILNLTPDSFSDGAPEADVTYFINRARALIENGADVLDIGGESTRPGALPVSPSDEINRVLPFLRAFRDLYPNFPVSLDTQKYEVALAAMPYGIQYFNDVSFLADERLAVLAKHSNAHYILMHTRGTPQTMQQQTEYPDGILHTLKREIEGRLESLRRLHFPNGRLLLDPGFGFAKTPEQCVELMDHLDFWNGFGLPLLLGVSRKRFLQKYIGDAPPNQRDAISVKCAEKAFLAGFRAFRVHEVAMTKKALTQLVQKDYK